MDPTDPGSIAAESTPEAAATLAGEPASRPAAERAFPTRGDALIAGASERFGGPVGTHASSSDSLRGPVAALILLSLAGFVVGQLLKWPCMADGWSTIGRYTHLCYSDIPPLYSGRGFDQDIVPYLQQIPGVQPLEYPVVIGFFNWLTALLTPDLRSFGAELQWFYAISVIGLAIAGVVTVVATALTVPRRVWDGVMVALAPGMILASTINWDLLAVALTALALMVFARSDRHRSFTYLSGALLGAGAAAKLYPALILGPLVLLAIRARTPRVGLQVVLGAVGGWLALNLPVMLANPAGWSYFYRFSAERGLDFGSPWLALQIAGVDLPPETVNLLGIGSFLVLCGGIAWLIFAAPIRPRLASVAFLVVAAFAVTNKVYSPQFVVWLIPLAVLAHPKWRDFLIWQGAEVVYFIAIWWYLAGLEPDTKGLLPQWYAAAILIHILGLAFFSAMVIRDALRPRHDVVRDGSGIADPGGGALNGAGAQAATSSAAGYSAPVVAGALMPVSQESQRAHPTSAPLG